VTETIILHMRDAYLMASLSRHVWRTSKCGKSKPTTQVPVAVWAAVVGRSRNVQAFGMQSVPVIKSELLVH
jgi:hypothetical protein